MKISKILLVGLTFSCALAAEAGNLKDLSLTPVKTAGVDLPTVSLVHLDLSRGFDPFHVFQEGMAAKSENPLIITNTQKNLEISLGGFNYINNEVDGALTTKITALDFSQTSQRFLVQSYNGGLLSYELIINVDRVLKKAAVWMRTTTQGKKSPWKVAAVYGK